jgi:hypothetical protein
MQSVQSYKRRTVSERSKVEKEAVKKGSKKSRVVKGGQSGKEAVQ